MTIVGERTYVDVQYCRSCFLGNWKVRVRLDKANVIIVNQFLGACPQTSALKARLGVGQPFG